jgi:predicted lysophospholipase L1 biosynthesis ABC-type transport system permease subunit
VRALRTLRRLRDALLLPAFFASAALFIAAAAFAGVPWLWDTTHPALALAVGAIAAFDLAFATWLFVALLREEL